MKEGQIKTFNALTLHQEGLSFSQLLEETGLSNTALSNYLKEMQETGLIKKDYKHRKYLLPTIYQPMKDFANDWQRFMKGSAVQFVNLGSRISNMKNKEKRKEALQSYLEATFNLLTLFLWKIIGESTRKFENFENLKDQDLMLEKSRIINNEIQNWIITIADSLATSMLLNVDILNEAGNPVYQEILQQAKQNMQKLENSLKLPEKGDV